MSRNKTTRDISDIQENQIAKLLNGKVQSNSGGGKFNGGDVLTNNFLIEAKTTMTPKASFGIKLKWLIKADRQAYEQNKLYYALAFRFAKNDNDFFVINGDLMKKLVSYIERSDDERQE